MITKEKFSMFEAIRKSGLTNMFDINMICELSYYVLLPEDCRDIMRNYDKYTIEFKSKKGE